MLDNHIPPSYDSNGVIIMKKYTIELDNDLAAIYEDIAKMNGKTIEEALQIILKNVIDTLLRQNKDVS